MARKVTDPKARLDKALRTQRKVQKDEFRQRRERGNESSVIRTFVAWVRGDVQYYAEAEDFEAQAEKQKAEEKRTMGVLVLITVMLALIVFLLMIVAIRVARS